MSLHDHEASLFAKSPIVTAVAVGLLSLAPHLFLSREASLGFSAVLLGVIAGVYFGFAVMRGSPRDQLVELGVASGFRHKEAYNAVLEAMAAFRRIHYRWRKNVLVVGPMIQGEPAALPICSG